MPLDDYNYYEVESGRSETLVQALDKIEKLEEGLNKAIAVIQAIINEDRYNMDEDRAYIEEALEEIKTYVHSK